MGSASRSFAFAQDSRWRFSRQRLATMHLSFAVGHGIEWFVYDQERKIWCLYRLRNEYLSDHLGQFAHNFS